MPERRIVVDHLQLSYEGLFDASKLYALIDSWFYEKGWDKEERINQEILSPEGKQTHIILQPFKNISDYYKLVIKITMNLTDVKDVEVEKNGSTQKLNQGLVKFTFDGYVVSDRHSNWEKSPLLWFMRVMFDKYIFKKQFSRAETWLLSDVEDLHTRIKNFLNIFKYETYAQREL
ncbi:MAG: hypothetical protein CMH61_00120 [Nanoarchaeota archaeon]|nr:hypothetical protein [Nanoarchaeota archaeon]